MIWLIAKIWLISGKQSCTSLWPCSDCSPNRFLSISDPNLIVLTKNPQYSDQIWSACVHIDFYGNRPCPRKPNNQIWRQSTVPVFISNDYVELRCKLSANCQEVTETETDESLRIYVIIVVVVCVTLRVTQRTLWNPIWVTETFRLKQICRNPIKITFETISM